MRNAHYCNIIVIVLLILFLFKKKGCPWSSGGSGGAEKCPKTGAVGSKAQCPGSKSGYSSNTGKSSK